MPMPVLCLDLARQLGWAAGVPGERPRYGTVELRGTSHGAVYASLVDWLEAAIALHKPAEIIAEAPLQSGGHSGQQAAMLAFGMLAHVELICFDHGIRLLTEHVQTTRKQVMGRGHFPKGTAKDAVKEWCIAKGYAAPDDNARDALVLFLHVEKLRMGRAA